MDWFEVAVAAFSGGIGGLIGSLLARKIENKRTRAIVFAAPAILAIQLLPLLAKNFGLRDMIFPLTKAQLSMRKHGESLVADPAVKQAIAGMSAAEVSQFTQEKSHAGLKRLSLPDLKEWNALRLKFAAANKDFCAGLWTGKIKPDLVFQTLNKLDPNDSESFLAISEKATLLEINNAPYEPSGKDAFPKGISFIQSKLNKEDLTRFNAAMTSSTNAASDDACWAATKLLNSYAEMNDSDGAEFLRAIASL